MLDNELYGLSELLTIYEWQAGSKLRLSISKCGQLKTRVEDLCARARQNWTLALFSDRHNDVLCRYFSYHQNLIGDSLVRLTDLDLLISNENTNSRLQEISDHTKTGLYKLLSHLQTCYSKFFDQELYAPPYYQRQFITGWDTYWNKASVILRRDGMDVYLTDLIANLIDQVAENTETTYHYKTLNYLHNLIRKIAELDKLQPGPMLREKVVEILLSLNFNHLDFFIYLQKRIGHSGERDDYDDRIENLKRLQQEYFYHLDREVPAYDPQCPSIYKLIYHWVKEELTIIEIAAPITDVHLDASQLIKMSLDLPVPYMALLLKMIKKAGWCKTVSLHELFQFTASHFESKRMPNMSWRSLRKECYNVSQQTAARVKEMLQLMIGLIDRHYFPVWAAISATSFFL